MTNQDRMPFGKYAGIRIADVPASYLLDLVKTLDLLPAPSHNQKHVREYIHENMAILEDEIAKERENRRRSK